MLDRRRIDVTGTGYDCQGTFQDGKKQIDSISDEHLLLALRIGMLCNDAKVERTNDGKTILGDPTEAALIVVAEKAGMNQKDFTFSSPVLAKFPWIAGSQTYGHGASHVERSDHRIRQGSTAPLIAASNSKWSAEQD